MKKILFIALLAFGMNVKAQITFEHTYDTASTENLLYNEQNQLMIINFAVSGYRYVKVNQVSQSICIYDMTHTLLKTISYDSLPFGLAAVGGAVLYISENLFSTDSKIAFMYVWASSSSPVALYHTAIMNEDGTILFSDTCVPAIRVNYEQQQLPIYCTPNGTKMIVSYRNRQAKVFSLPGTLYPCSTTSNIDSYVLNALSSISNPYPNPTNNSTQIDYKLPDGVNEGEIVFYDLMGNEVKRFTVDKTFNSLLVSTADITAGTYYYQLQTTGQSSEVKKMLVIK